ncbi:MAG: bifunctional UDP-N-acetylmuramoyl-tripeptide:D-alanyl-D-alanine ligase/alanine racemase [Bacteroidia bacterium]|nr:bifunctional UDP-N-acetylmuramoyl-tripeptide:D-alanyl-D-alanine ligase/alanine racemase [Bacteroidia bacterium]
MIGTPYTLQEIAEILGTRAVIRQAAEPVQSVVFDSRQVFRPAQTLFVALKGEKRDGHQFIDNAFEKGVHNYLVSDPHQVPEGCNYIQVPDTLAALQQFATFHRQRFSLPLLAITGSNGKTIVKEWISTLLDKTLLIVKSPKSYNSQVGVPLSLLQLNPAARLGIFEAGISRPGEMEALQVMIQPQLGLLTHFGDAHEEGFPAKEAKLLEKLKLFQACQAVFATADDPLVLKHLQNLNLPLITIGRDSSASIRLISAVEKKNSWEIQLQDQGEIHFLKLGLGSQADLENGLLAILVARHFRLSFPEIQEGLEKLQAVSMRMDLISDNPEITIINDAYNADLSSIHNAFSLLFSDEFQPGKALILSDLEHQGQMQEKIQQEVLQEAVKMLGNENIILIGPVFQQISQGNMDAYATTEDFLREFDYQRFRNKTVLLKGARRFELEKIIPYLSRRVNATLFKVNLNHLSGNLRFFRSLVPRGTKIMAMVKAFAYGSGTWEIAQALERDGIDYLAVAYLSEGIALRTRNISRPIMVMNPDQTGIEQLFHFDLEPEVYSLDFLKKYLATGKMLGATQMKVHLKVETGMHRLGFRPAELITIQAFLADHPALRVVSVFSHLAAADESDEDAYSHAQVQTLTGFADQLEKALSYKPLRHILNTAGILRFPEYSLDMVRLGLGLYGLSPVPGLPFPELQEVGSLHTIISQLNEYPAGTSIGYGRSQVTERVSRIATLPIGYADGIPRALSNGRVSFLVHGKLAPVIGRVCMDMLMLDVTDIPGVAAGDEVVLFGPQGQAFQSVEALAGGAGTIAYEILSGISPRVRRVYVRE